MTILHLFLLHRTPSRSVPYVSPTEDDRLQTAGMARLGLLTRVSTEVCHIIVADTSTWSTTPARSCTLSSPHSSGAGGQTVAEKMRALRSRQRPLTLAEVGAQREPAFTTQAPAVDADAGAIDAAQGNFGNALVLAALDGAGAGGLGPLIASDVEAAFAGVSVGSVADGGNQVILRRMRTGRSAEAAVSASMTGAGTPLPAAVQARFEAAFGRDLSHVRIHTGGTAAGASEAIAARAFTVGADIFFGSGEWAPGTPQGDRLLAHELTHVVQHDEGRVRSRGGGLEVSEPSDATEHEAVSNEAHILGLLPSTSEVASTLAADVFEAVNDAAGFGADEDRGAQTGLATADVAQRDCEDDGTCAEEERDPTEGYDATTLDPLMWEGFTATWRDTVQRAIDARTEAERLEALVPEAHRVRLREPRVHLLYMDGVLAGSLVNLVDYGGGAEQDTATDRRPDPQLETLRARSTDLYTRFEDGTDHLEGLNEGWAGLIQARVFDTLASLSEARLRLAREIRAELNTISSELDEIKRQVGAATVRDVPGQLEDQRDAAQRQLAVAAILGVVLTTVTIVNPVLGAVLAIGAAGVSIFLDGSATGSDSASAVGGAAGAVENLSRAGTAATRLSTAAGRVNTAATVNS